MRSTKRKLRSLQDLCLDSYLHFLETECKTWIDLKNSKSRLLQTACARIIPSLQEHLASFLSGTASSNLRGTAMFFFNVFLDLN